MNAMRTLNETKNKKNSEEITCLFAVIKGRKIE